MWVVSRFQAFLHGGSSQTGTFDALFVNEGVKAINFKEGCMLALTAADPMNIH